MEDSRLGPPSADCTWVELDGRVAAHSARTREVQLLNHSGSAVWRLLDGTRTLGDVVAQLSLLYGVPADELRPQVENVVADLERAGLLEVQT